MSLEAKQNSALLEAKALTRQGESCLEGDLMSPFMIIYSQSAYNSSLSGGGGSSLSVSTLVEASVLGQVSVGTEANKLPRGGLVVRPECPILRRSSFMLEFASWFASSLISGAQERFPSKS